MNKILIVTPAHTKMNEDTLRCVFELSIPTDTIVDYFIPWQGYPNPDPEGRENLVEKQNQARALTLSGGYTHLLFVEEDMLIPQDSLEKLLSTQADVAYGLYCFRRYPHTWNAVAALDPETLNWFPYNVGSSDFINAMWGSSIPVDGLGFGCTLISRDVLSKIEFRVDWDRPHPNGEVSHSDVYFALDCLEAGFTQVCNTDVVCGHITPTPAPSVITPVPIYKGLERTAYRFLPYGGFDGETPIQRRYEEWLHTPSDIREHLPYLYQIAKGVVVELGARYGASTSAFVAAKEDGLCDAVFSFDIDPSCSRLLEIPGYAENLTLFIGESTKIPDEVPNQIDILFVDTEHTYAQVTAELNAWLPRVKDGGLLLFHDTELPEVKRAIEEHPMLQNSIMVYLENSHGLGVVTYYAKRN